MISACVVAKRKLHEQKNEDTSNVKRKKVTERKFDREYER